jgi:dihydrofolate reductase
MAKLIYSALTSLDGYIADEEGNFDWAVPDEEVHAFINELVRPVGTHLYGRRMYEMMIGWENDPSAAEQSPSSGDFAEIWRAADKVVYSRTLEEVSTKKTSIERDFDPEAVRRMKGSSKRDMSVSGRAGGRVPSVPGPHRDRGGQEGPPRGRSRGAGTAGRAPLR